MVWFSILYHRIVPQSDRWKIVIVGDQNSSCPWAQNSKLPLPAYLLFQRGDSLSHMQVFFFNLTEGQKKREGGVIPPDYTFYFKSTVSGMKNFTSMCKGLCCWSLLPAGHLLLLLCLGRIHEQLSFFL